MELNENNETQTSEELGVETKTTVNKSFGSLKKPTVNKQRTKTLIHH